MTRSTNDQAADLTIEALALGETDAIASAAIWREIARAAIALLNERHIELERLRARYHAALDANRRLQKEAV